MEKLKKYLDKNGIDYKETTYGESYFYNTNPVLFTGLLIAWDFDDPETAAKMQKERRLIEKYADRYGYTIGSRGGHLGNSWIAIWKTSDAQALRFYRMFSDVCIEKWEVMQHRYLRGDFPSWTNADFERISRLLMDKYGRDYNEYIANIAA